jgi:hypothetical protein
MEALKLSRIFLLLCLAVSQSSCSLFERNLARRYRNQSENIFDASVGNAATFVDIKLNSSLVKDADSPVPIYNLLSLTPEGQAQLITSVENKSPNLTTLIDQITTNFSFNKEAKPNIKIIGNTIRRVLVFSVDRKFATIMPGPAPSVTINGKADRIDFLELQVDLPLTAPVVFNSWDRFVTKFANLDLGKVSQSQQFSASLNLNANAGSEITLTGTKGTEDFNSDKETNSSGQIIGSSTTNNNTNGATGELITTGKTTGSTVTSNKTSAGLGASGNLTFSDKYETSLDLRSRIIDLSGSLADKKIIVRQESGPGLDLSGNQTIVLEYALTDDWRFARFTKFKQLFNAGVPVPLAGLIDNSLTIVFPNILSDVTGTMSYQFLYRQVNRGSRHIPEARQKVTYRYGQIGMAGGVAPINVALIKKADIRPKSYMLKSPLAAGGFVDVLFNGNPLSFETLLDAENFLHYIGALINSGGPLAGVTISGAVIAPVSYKNLVIQAISL